LQKKLCYTAGPENCDSWPVAMPAQDKISFSYTFFLINFIVVFIHTVPVEYHGVRMTRPLYTSRRGYKMRVRIEMEIKHTGASFILH
jgi:hypothetical protein